MTRFTITLRHSRGRIAIETWARNLDQALRQVLNAECAPVSAILTIAEQDA